MQKGTVEFVEFESTVLKGNPLGDPATRRFPLYFPPGYDSRSSTRYPTLFGLTGFTGRGEMYLNRSFFFQPMNEIYDELIVKGCPPFIAVLPDCCTKYGGSQYVNSSAVGNYEDYLVKELVPFIDSTYKTNGTHIAVGGSSGGIGSFTLGARHPEVFQGIGDHSGDSAFEYCYLKDVAKFVLAMEKYDYSVAQFMEQLYDRSLPKDSDVHVVLNMIAMCACYCPNPESDLGFDFPFDIKTGEIDNCTLKKMLAFDPVRMVAPYEKNLRLLKGIFVDCGSKDQFDLFLGARQLHAKLDKHAIAHRYEEYASDHFLLRQEQKKKSIPFLLNACELPKGS